MWGGRLLRPTGCFWPNAAFPADPGRRHSRGRSRHVASLFESSGSFSQSLSQPMAPGKTKPHGADRGGSGSGSLLSARFRPEPDHRSGPGQHATT